MKDPLALNFPYLIREKFQHSSANSPSLPYIFPHSKGHIRTSPKPMENSVTPFIVLMRKGLKFLFKKQLILQLFYDVFRILKILRNRKKDSLNNSILSSFTASFRPSKHLRPLSLNNLTWDFDISN